MGKLTGDMRMGTFSAPPNTCSLCGLDTAGNHAASCPLHPDNLPEDFKPATWTATIPCQECATLTAALKASQEKVEGLEEGNWAFNSNREMWAEIVALRLKVARQAGDIESLQTQRKTMAKEATKVGMKVARLVIFEHLERESWDLRCVSVPTGGDDYDVHWQVIEHYQAEPQEREIGYGTTPEEAIKQALAGEEGKG